MSTPTRERKELTRRTYPPGASERIAWVLVITARGVALSEQSDDPSWQLFLLDPRIGSSFYIIQKHVYILDAILQDPPTPLNLVEEELRLKTTRDLKRSPAVASGNSMRDEQLPLNLRLDG